MNTNQHNIKKGTKKMRKFIAAALILATLCSLCACSSGKSTVEYKTDVAVYELAEQITAINDNWN